MRHLDPQWVKIFRLKGLAWHTVTEQSLPKTYSWVMLDFITFIRATDLVNIMPANGLVTSFTRPSADMTDIDSAAYHLHYKISITLNPLHWNAATVIWKLVLDDQSMVSYQGWINSLWPTDTIWRLRTGSILAQVMACCLTAPIHYLNQCWLIISKVQWHSPVSNFTRDTSAISHRN